MEKLQNWLTLIFMCAILGFLAFLLINNSPQYVNLASFVAIVITAIYVSATFRMVREMKRTRLEARKPSLSLWPEGYTFGGGYTALLLRNAGGLAKNLEIDIETKDPDEAHHLFIPALDMDHIVTLPVKTSSKIIEVIVKYVDSYNLAGNEKLTIDFVNLSKQGRALAFQHAPLLLELDDLRREMRGIKDAINSRK